LEGTLFDAEHIDIQEAFRTQHNYGLDFSDVKGQQSIKRCMEIAAACGQLSIGVCVFRQKESVVFVCVWENPS
tara:strand:- start:213 stop:431 length:219 start_codon:yes stop_codon:yes gene_type:complete